MLLKYEEYLLYLRKSRQDSLEETVEEVLYKHELILQEFAEKEFGGRIPEENIYREVMSGESLDAREEIKKVLARMEDPRIKGILVIEPQRLSRGDLEDCGRLISDLRYTHTKVITPYMSYDLENKMERRFFQDELLRGHEYLEYTKEILSRGRVAAVKRGCYIFSVPPYGYKKIKIGKDPTLEIIPEEAETVKYIFDLYIKQGMSTWNIAKNLNELHIKTQTGLKWNKGRVQCVLTNEHYLGLVITHKTKETIVIENGERKIKTVKRNEEDIIKAKGLHSAIIDLKTWEAAQDMMASRSPKVKHNHQLKNLLSTIIVCSNCGKSLKRALYRKDDDRYVCSGDTPCFKTYKMDAVNNAVLHALENAELPALKFKISNGDGDALKIQRTLLDKYEKKMDDYKAQENKQFDLLEQGTYSTEVFEQRHAILRAKMDECQALINTTRANLPDKVDYTERLASLEKAIKALKNPKVSTEKKNTLLRAIIERIEYTGTPRGQGKPKDNSFSLKVFLRL